MNTSTPKFPFYAKAALLLIGLYVLISMLSIAQDIILPVMYAGIIAILISPVVHFLVKKKMNRAVAIASVLLLAMLIFAGLTILLSSQTSILIDALPQLTDKFEELLQKCVKWVSGYFNISQRKINTWITETKIDLMDNSNSVIGTTITTLGAVLATTFLTPVYIFMFLFYQAHIIEFIHKSFGVGHNENVTEILTETKSIIQSYLVGLFLEFVIIAVMNAVGLLIIGIDYAILLGIAGALLNIIPYVGGLIAVLLFSIIALVTKSPIHVVYVLSVYTIIQFIDNNYIVPKIIGSKVKLNAFISLLAVIAGAAVWGIPGMFLSIPITAILKLIFDRIEPLQPLGFLMGDTADPLLKLPRKKKPVVK